MTMIIPSEIDLRSNIDNVYYQGPTNKCCPFSCKGAIETAFDRSPTHQGVRVSADYIYARGKFWAGYSGDTGLHPEKASLALARDGVSLNWNDYQDLYTQPDQATIDLAKQVTPIDMVRMPWYNDDIILSIKRSLAFGFPVIIVLNLCVNFYNIYPGSWKTMDWDANQPTNGEHAVVIVGYDDACGRFLIENSWGAHNGDGGFYGFKYDKFLPGPQCCVTQYWRMENLPVKPQRVPGFTAGTPTLSTGEASEFYERFKPHMTSYLNTLIGQNLIDECIRFGVSDKMLESIKGWARGSMATNLPGVNFTGMHYDSPTGYWFITSQECLEFVQRNKTAAYTMFENVLVPQGVVEMMGMAKALGYSDKHIEYLANWERGQIRDNAHLFGLSLSDIILDLL